MSWPFGPDECPRCRYLEPFDRPDHDDSGYEVIGLCSHPRIAMDLFVSQRPGGCDGALPVLRSQAASSPRPGDEGPEAGNL